MDGVEASLNESERQCAELRDKTAALGTAKVGAASAAVAGFSGMPGVQDAVTGPYQDEIGLYTEENYVGLVPSFRMASEARLFFKIMFLLIF